MAKLNGQDFPLLIRRGPERNLESEASFNGNLPQPFEPIFTTDTNKLMYYRGHDRYIQGKGFLFLGMNQIQLH